jgi:hypothetical protein
MTTMLQQAAAYRAKPAAKATADKERQALALAVIGILANQAVNGSAFGRAGKGKVR